MMAPEKDPIYKLQTLSAHLLEEDTLSSWDEEWMDKLCQWRETLFKIIKSTPTEAAGDVRVLFLHAPRRAGKTVTLYLLVVLIQLLHGDAVHFLSRGRRPALKAKEEVQKLCHQCGGSVPSDDYNEMFFLNSHRYYQLLSSRYLRRVPFLLVDNYSFALTGSVQDLLTNLQEENKLPSLVLVTAYGTPELISYRWNSSTQSLE